MILRELLVTLGLDVDSQSVLKGLTTFKGLELAAEKVIETFREFFHETIEAADQVGKMSQKTGIASEALQKLQYAGSLADVSVESINTSVGILSKNLLHASEGSEEQGKAFRALGIHIKDSNGHLRSADEVIGDVAEKFKEMPDGTRKTGLAMELFGRAGKDMIPLLNEGKEGLAEMGEEAEKLGLVIGGDAIKASTEINDDLKRLHATTVGLWREAIGPLLPQISELVKRFLEWRKENAGILKQRIETFVRVLVFALKVLGKVLDSVIKNFYFVVSAAGALVAAFYAVKVASVEAAWASAKAWLASMAPFLAIAAVIAALYLIFDDLRVYQKGGRSMFGYFEKAINKWMQPKEGDWWLVKQLKEFIHWLQEAWQYAKEFKAWLFGEKGGAPSGSNAFEIQRNSPDWKKAMSKTPLNRAQEIQRRIDANDPTLNQSDIDYWKTHKADVLMRMPGDAAPMARVPAGGSSSNVTKNTTVNMNVTQHPGEDGQALAERVVREFRATENAELFDASPLAR